MKKIVRVALCIVSVMLIVSCGKSNADGHSDMELNQTDHLNIAKQMVPGYIPLYIMEDKKWLEEAYSEAGYQINVTYTEFESGPPENEAFASGELDVGVMGNVPAISGIAAGQKRNIIGIAYNGEQTIGVLVRRDSEIESIIELKNKKIGIVIGSIAQDFLNELLKKSNLTMSDVELVNLGISEMETALGMGQVDAVAVWNPAMLKLCDDGIARLLADGTGVYTGENVIIANMEYMERNPDIVRIFMEQYKRAVEELVGNMDRYAEEYADVTGLSSGLLQETWKNSNFPVYLSDADEISLAKTAGFLYEENLVNVNVDVSEYVIYSFDNGDR